QYFEVSWCCFLRAEASLSTETEKYAVFRGFGGAVFYELKHLCPKKPGNALHSPVFRCFITEPHPGGQGASVKARSNTSHFPLPPPSGMYLQAFFSRLSDRYSSIPLPHKKKDVFSCDFPGLHAEQSQNAGKIHPYFSFYFAES
ncbi:MAG: hypothetical protein J5947_04715, partial [Clostridium sp.]|nr:hypothetical protein [Clostridium sp.]